MTIFEEKKLELKENQLKKRYQFKRWRVVHNVPGTYIDDGCNCRYGRFLFEIEEFEKIAVGEKNTSFTKEYYRLQKQRCRSN